ncbi:beta-1,4-galactosyltransferase 2 isoform X2 [Channa argus]|uniref:beta-1,4-galactosyltransferase 2 isoform X2 n=1 Tax=Channa argus TaxID=215402 RepID=UPI00352254C8
MLFSGYCPELELKDKFSGSRLSILSWPLGTRCRRRAKPLTKPQSLNSPLAPVLIVSSTGAPPCPLSVPVLTSIPVSADPSPAQPRAAKQRGPHFRSTNSPSPHDQAAASELHKQLPVVLDLLTYLWDSCIQATDPETCLAKVKQVGQVISSRTWLVSPPGAPELLGAPGEATTSAQLPGRVDTASGDPALARPIPVPLPPLRAAAVCPVSVCPISFCPVLARPGTVPAPRTAVTRPVPVPGAEEGSRSFGSCSSAEDDNRWSTFYSHCGAEVSVYSFSSCCSCLFGSGLGVEVACRSSGSTSCQSGSGAEVGSHCSSTRSCSGSGAEVCSLFRFQFLSVWFWRRGQQSLPQLLLRFWG